MALTRPRLALLLTLVAACCIAYWPGLKGPFFLDDFGNTLLVTPKGADVRELYDIATRNESGPLRRPIPNLSFAANYLARDLSPFNYKAFNLALHGITAFVLFFLTLTLARARLEPRQAEAAAWLAAFAWALHPLHASTTLYVVQRMAQFSTVFMLLSVLAFARWRLREGAAQARESLIMAALAGGFGLLALLSKENAILIPLLLATVELYARWCVRHRDGAIAKWFKAAVIWLPLLVLVTATAYFWPRVEASYTIRDFTMSERLATQAVIVPRYLKELLWPSIGWMSLFHDDVVVRSPRDIASLVGAGLIAALITLALAFGRRAPGLALGILWFFAAHLLESSFYGLELAWEHRNYLPAAGLFAGIAIEVVRLAARHGLTKQALLASALTVAILGGLTHARSNILSSNASLAAHQLKTHPKSLRTQLVQLAIDQQTRSEPLIWLRLATILQLESNPVRAHLLGVLASCEVGPFWPHIYSAIRGLETARFHPGYALQIERIVQAQEAGQCRLLDPDILVQLAESALHNPNFDEPRFRQSLQVILARALRLGGIPSEVVEDILIDSFETYPRNFAPLLHAITLRMVRGDVEGAAELYSVLLERQREFDRKVGYILTEVGRDIEAMRAMVKKQDRP